MVEFLFKIGILIALVLALFAIVMTIPAFAALFTTATGSTAATVSAINTGFGLIASYTRPFMALLNIMIGNSGRVALTALIVWLMVKPIAFKILAPLELALEKLIEKS